MPTRRITRQVIGVAVLALLLAAPGGGQAGIMHRYSFTTDAKDSVGGADAVLYNGATISGGMLQLDGIDSYAGLPIGATLDALTNATFEAWVVWDHDVGTAWSRVFDFGHDPSTNMFLTLRNGSNLRPRFALTTNGPGNEQQVQAAAAFPVQQDAHIAVTIDADNQVASLYVNGKIATIVYNFTNNPSLLSAVGMGTDANWLGRSQYADPLFTGAIDEFRIYNTALTAAQISASFAAGPDGTPP